MVADLQQQRQASEQLRRGRLWFNDGSCIATPAGRVDYNTSWPRTSLRGLTPIEFATSPKAGHLENRLSS